MPALQHKLLRTIRTTLGQFLALVLIVLAGVCAYYGMNTAVIRLVAAQEQYYRETAFADYYFDVVRAPAGIVNQIQQLPGVVAVSGRIQKDVKVVRTEGVFDTGRLTSYAPQTAINRLQLTGGRFFDFNPSGGEAEIMIDPQYARAWKLKTGDPLKVIIEGRQLTFRITGTARSAEFMFKTKNPLEFPDFDNMAIIMIPQQQARQVLGMPGQINQILITASPGAEQSGLKEAVNKILQPYGVTGSYPRADQSGHKYVQSQVDTLVLAARLMPPGFFLVAMVMQFVLLRRLIKSQRLQIGVMKALGYKNSAIMAMYTEYSLAVTTAGILSGCLAGSGLARMVAGLFGQLLELPVTTGGINWPVFFYVVMVTTGVVWHQECWLPGNYQDYPAEAFMPSYLPPAKNPWLSNGRVFGRTPIVPGR
jgi:putative ABC transport system permease protein